MQHNLIGEQNNSSCEMMFAMMFQVTEGYYPSRKVVNVSHKFEKSVSWPGHDKIKVFGVLETVEPQHDRYQRKTLVLHTQYQNTR